MFQVLDKIIDKYEEFTATLASLLVTKDIVWVGAFLMELKTYKVCIKD